MLLHLLMIFFFHDNGKELVHILLGSFLHMERCDLVVVNGSLFKHTEEVLDVFEDLISRHLVAEVLRHLDD